MSQTLWNLGFHGLLSTLLITIPSCIAAALAVAWMFHLAVERRFLNTPIRTSARETGPGRPRPAAPTVAS